MKRFWNKPTITALSVKKITLSGSANGSENNQPTHKN